MPRTQEQRKAETRRRLLNAAASLFARDGYAAVTVDQIGEVAERTSGSVYAHFGSKQGVLLALLEGFQDDLAAVIGAEFAAREQLPDRLLGLWRNVADHPDPEGGPWFFLEIELWLQAARDPDLRGPLRERYRIIHALMRDEFRAWVREFDLRPPIEVDALPQAVMAALMGLQMQRTADPSAVSEELALSVLLALFGAGTQELPKNSRGNTKE